jgi:ATP-dependent RNA helicase DOB1
MGLCDPILGDTVLDWASCLSFQKQLKDLEDERDAIVIADEDKIKDYYSLLEQWRDLRSTIRDIVFAPKHSLPFLQPGRIVRVLAASSGGIDEEGLLTKEEKGFWGVVVNFEKLQSGGKNIEEGER